jgi:N-acetyl-alpha-D-glucosaminyl L-malate synthase BshA
LEIGRRLKTCLTLACYAALVKIGITCYPTYGGSGIVATELGVELAARGHDIHFISYANPIRLDHGIPRIHYHEVEVSNYPLFQYPPYCLALASRMATVAEAYELDLLHVHYAIPHSISALLAQQMTPHRRLPFVTTLHGTDITLVGTDRTYFPITKFSIEKSNGITTISNYLEKQTVEFFGVANPIRVIHNFVNCDVYKPDYGKRNEEKILIHLSNFRPVKRILDCVRILHAVRQATPARLWMVGDGPERSSAEMLAHELGVSKYVDFMGKQDHVERIIPKADVLLMPSEMEAFGLAALEAMACGVPPVGTRTGGVAELITHDVDGFVEPVGDIAAQSARVIALLTEAPLYARLSAAARNTAETRYCASKIIPQYERYYEEVCA